MAVGFGGHGGVSAAAAQNASPAYPASVAAGDALVLVRAAKPDTAILATPAGWTLLDEQAGGAGVFGNDTGPVRMCVYWREADGSETGTLTCSSTLGTVDVQQAAIARYTKAGGTTWSVAGSGGVDSIAGTDWVVTSDDVLGIQAGDVIQVALSWPTDSARTWSAEGLSASGATFVAVSVPLTSGATGLGADMASRLHAFGCSSGASSAQAVYTGTVNSATNVTGPTTMVRLREVSSGAGAVTLIPATVTLSAPTVTATPGPVAVGLVPAVLTLSTPPVAAAPGVVTVSLAPVVTGIAATAVAPLPGPTSVALTPAGFALSAIPVGAAPGLVTVILTPVGFAVVAGTVGVESESVAARGTVRTPARSTIRSPARSGVRIR